MSSDKEQIYAIMTRYFQGNIPDEELVTLENWKSEKAANRIEFDDLAELWRRTGKFQFSEKIDTDRALSDVHRRSAITQKQVFKLTLVQQIAAILILSVLFSGLYTWFFLRNPADDRYYEEVQAACGTRTRVELPDGSSAFLNSGSSLRFPGKLTTQKERRVELKGEGYFNVTKDPERPFIVDAGKISIKALGTAFNVNAYEPESGIDVALVEGKVSVHVEQGKNSGTGMMLEPNELARFNAGENSLSKELIRDPRKYTGWTEGKMIFKDDPIRDVVRRMENWYHVNIRLQDKELLNYRFTGTFVDEPLEEILNTFSLTSPMRYEIIQGAKNMEGVYSKRTIILRTR